ncbi:peptide ABC transporter substrate-binding protein [Candidatus Parcubacteria bacterium]|nr:peptide ABC transporter substrate-binding protein [Candidatus Parcubacteria bacterium]
MFSIKSFFQKSKDKIKSILSRQNQKSQIHNDLDQKLVLGLSKTKIPSLGQLRQLPKFLSIKEKRIIKILFLIIFICLIFQTGYFYLTHIKIVPASAGDYIEAVIGSPQYINPIFSSVNDVDADLTQLIFSGLLKYDNITGELKPDLCETYEISEDLKSYTFYLRDNLLWQDGEPLTVDDIIFTVELIKHPEIEKSPLRVSFIGVDIEKIDDKTVKFILQEPYTPFLSVLTFGILPKHIWEDVNLYNLNLAEYNLKPVGSGPYRVKSRVIDRDGNIKSYVLTINDKYYNDKPFIKNLTLIFFSDYNEAVNALKTKSIQGLSFPPIDLEEELLLKESLDSYPLILPKYTAIFFNQGQNQFLEDKNIREALGLAIDKNKIAQVLMKNRVKLIDGPILSNYKDYHQEISEIEFNVEKSKELIEKAKFKKEEDSEFYKKKINVDGKIEEQELLVSLTLIDSPQNTELAEMIKSFWKEIGVNTEINLLEISEIKKAIDDRNYQALLYSEILGFDPDPYPFWHSSQISFPGLNLSGFSNKEADKLLEDARIVIDKNIRIEKYKKFQEILNAEKAAVFLFQPVYDYVIDKNIKNVNISNIVVPSDRFSNINEWYIKTERQFSWNLDD